MKVTNEDIDKAKFAMPAEGKATVVAPIFMGLMLVFCIILAIFYTPWLFILCPLIFLGMLLTLKIIKIHH